MCIIHYFRIKIVLVQQSLYNVSMNRNNDGWIGLLAWLVCVGAIVLLYLVSSIKTTLLNEPEKLRVVMRNAPTIYYEWRDEPAGFEYDLVHDFAKQMKWELEIVLVGSLEEALEKLQDEEVDMASAAISITPKRRERMDFSPAYYQVRQEVVCAQSVDRPESIAELAGKELEVISQSSYAERLSELQRQYPELTWREVTGESTETLLEKVAGGELECTVADSNILAIQRRYFPELRPALVISDEQSLAWAIPQGRHDLLEKVQKWLEEYRASGKLQLLKEKYYSHAEAFDYVDLKAFHARIESRLPKYREWFAEAAERMGFSWELLAAQAYQESHWNPRAKSPTGVRGIMMLTLSTAKQMKVSSRLDPRQSIRGGAKYLRWLYDRIPESVLGEERVRYALAAYNVGLGHVKDAMELAQRLNRDPNRWHDLAEVLPYLAKKKYYSTLPHGYARGWEPVTYVNNIMNYHDILQNKY